MSKYLRDRFRQEKEIGIIFCDLDGVLANFELGAEKLLGHPFDAPYTDKVEKEDRRRIIAAHEVFWETLPPMPDWHVLWSYINPHGAHILTALPSWDDNNAMVGKRSWVHRYLKIPDKRLQIVKREEKRLYATIGGKQNILIDDYERNIKEFEEAGGIGIHHLSAQRSIAQLKSLGIV